MQYVVDSNLLISAANKNEIGHHEASKVLTIIHKNNFEIIAPVLQLWELEAYFRHPEKSKGHSQSEIPFRVTHCDITSGLFSRTYREKMVAVTGADRVFVSLSMDYGVPMITSDKAILKYAEHFGIEAIHPCDFIERHSKLELS